MNIPAVVTTIADQVAIIGLATIVAGLILRSMLLFFGGFWLIVMALLTL